MTYDEYLEEVRITKPKFPYSRMGQVYYNVLKSIRPALAESIFEDFDRFNLDPFYQDKNIPAFLAWIAKRW